MKDKISEEKTIKDNKMNHVQYMWELNKLRIEFYNKEFDINYFSTKYENLNKEFYDCNHFFKKKLKIDCWLSMIIDDLKYKSVACTKCIRKQIDKMRNIDEKILNNFANWLKIKNSNIDEIKNYIIRKQYEIFYKLILLYIEESGPFDMSPAEIEIILTYIFSGGTEILRYLELDLNL